VNIKTNWRVNMNVAYDPTSGQILATGDNVTSAGGEVLYDVDPSLNLSLYTVTDGKLVLVPERVWQTIRAQRNALLKDTDWTQLADAPVTGGEWTKYRQILRDIPQTYAAIGDVVWPDPPNVGAKDGKVLTAISATAKPITK
jgi:hypothetical protein